MLKTNIPGSLATVSLIFLVVGYGISLNTSIEWSLYFKIVGSVFGIGSRGRADNKVHPVFRRKVVLSPPPSEL